jgi:hypothetical protein
VGRGYRMNAVTISDFSFCFHCQVGSSLLLHRPIETTAFIRTRVSTRDVC